MTHACVPHDPHTTRTHNRRDGMRKTTRTWSAVLGGLLLAACTDTSPRVMAPTPPQEGWHAKDNSNLERGAGRTVPRRLYRRQPTRDASHPATGGMACERQLEPGARCWEDCSSPPVPTPAHA